MTDVPSHTNVVIVVFAMHGCPACHDYLPRLHKERERFEAAGFSFPIYEPGIAIAPGAVPVLIYDSAAKDDGVQAFADRFEVTALPTTILLPRIGFPAKYEGALPDDEIYNLFNAALATR
jgi:hypothetical protein